ncbi:MAG: prepilin-type N-terminal cleavage/methylation domain-containing protein [Hyphomicrobiaceae bacterium]
MKYASTGSPAAWSPGQQIRAPENNRREGFTLLETLIALVILAFALQALYQAYSGGLRASKIANEHEQARILAQSLLAEHTSDRSLDTGSLTGTFEKFSWRISIAPAPEFRATSSPDSRWTLYRVTAEVAWPPHRHLQLATLRLGETND